MSSVLGRCITLSFRHIETTSLSVNLEDKGGKGRVGCILPPNECLGGPLICTQGSGANTQLLLLLSSVLGSFIDLIFASRTL